MIVSPSWLSLLLSNCITRLNKLSIILFCDMRYCVEKGTNDDQPTRCFGCGCSIQDKFVLRANPSTFIEQLQSAKEKDKLTNKMAENRTTQSCPTMSVSLSWHEKCLKCCACGVLLDRTCFVQEHATYCRMHYIRFVYIIII